MIAVAVFADENKLYQNEGQGRLKQIWSVWYPSTKNKARRARQATRSSSSAQTARWGKRGLGEVRLADDTQNGPRYESQAVKVTLLSRR